MYLISFREQIIRQEIKRWLLISSRKNDNIRVVELLLVFLDFLDGTATSLVGFLLCTLTLAASDDDTFAGEADGRASDVVAASRADMREEDIIDDLH